MEYESSPSSAKIQEVHVLSLNILELKISQYLTPNLILIGLLVIEPTNWVRVPRLFLPIFDLRWLWFACLLDLTLHLLLDFSLGYVVETLDCLLFVWASIRLWVIIFTLTVYHHFEEIFQFVFRNSKIEPVTFNYYFVNQ